MNRVFFIIISFLMASSDPINVEYFGGWPINLNKSEIKDPGPIDCSGDLKSDTCSCIKDEECYSGKCFNSPRVGGYCLQMPGAVLPQFKLMDQFGEEVNLYDFAGHGKFIVIEMSTSWCAPCQQLAAWITDNDLSVTSHKWWRKEYNIIRNLIADKKIFFINIQTQDVYKTPASIESLEDWYNMYTDEHVPILADSKYEVRDWVRPTGYPTIIVLNDKMEVVQFSLRGWHDAFNFITSIDWVEKNEVINE